MAERKRQRTVSYAASRIAVAYALGSAAWILLSDQMLELLRLDRALILRLATAKALAFVVITAGLLYGALRRRRVIGDTELDSLDRRAADADRIAETFAPTSGGAGGVDLVQAHNALAESEARLRLMIGAAAEGIVTCDERGMVMTWNREAQRIFGLSEEDAIGETVTDVIVPRREHERFQELLSGVKVNAPPASVDLKGIRRDGVEFPMELSIIAVEWGARSLHTVFIRDASDRVTAAQESERVAAIVNASADAIFAVSADGRITSWNPAAERIFGYDAESARGSSLARLFPAQATETVRWLLDSIGLGIALEATPVECARHGAETFNAFVSVSPMREAGAVSGAAVVVRDSSERLIGRDRVKDAEILASLGRLATAVGHQFNNVLMGIQPFVDVLKRHELPPQATRAVEQIATSVDRGRRVTAEIQSFTRASEAPKLRSLMVAKWLTGLRGELELTLGPGVVLDVAAEDGDLALAADPAKLRQVFLNLAANARDAMPNGGRLTISVRGAAVPPPHASGANGNCGWAEIIVRDSGDGIDEETQRRIFEPLFAKYRGGSGLELAAVQQIVRSHGGAIDVSSTPGQGTAFRIVLPRRAPEGEEPLAAAAVPHEPAPRRVLLVEDDTHIAIGLTQALVTHAMHVDVVHTGAQVMRAVRAFSPDVVVLDVILPDANGFDIYRDIAAVWPDLPVIFSTGHADEFDLEAIEPLRHPHVELLRKPYATETLLAAMDRVSTR
jgi:PAS domain S-box-containing protein